VNDAALKLLVCSGSLRHTENWCRAMGIRRRDVIHAGSVHSLEGLADFAVVRLPSFFRRPDWEKIEQTITRMELRRGRDF
jgi:hypothetical protein